MVFRKHNIRGLNYYLKMNVSLNVCWLAQFNFYNIGVLVYYENLGFSKSRENDFKIFSQKISARNLHFNH